MLYFYNCELQMREKTLKSPNSPKNHFSDFYCIINTKFWTTNNKILIKKVTLSDVYFFISTIVKDFFYFFKSNAK